MTVFPTTRVSAIRRTASDDDAVRTAALETVAEVYRAPICAYIRLTYHVSREDAEDLTQGFFAEALRRRLFAKYEPSRARFRTWIRLGADQFVSNAKKAEARIKRGGHSTMVSLEDLGDQLATTADPDRIFHDEWVRGVFGVAVARLRESCESGHRRTHFALFERYDLEGSRAGAPPTYAALATEFGIPVTQVTNWLASVRREFRELVLEVLRELTGSDEEFREEARALLGIDPR